MGAASAALYVGDMTWSMETAAEDCCAAFDCQLAAGATSLRSEIQAANGERRRGAYYVYISKV